jgi:hypothetical protein
MRAKESRPAGDQNPLSQHIGRSPSSNRMGHVLDHNPSFTPFPAAPQFRAWQGRSAFWH